MKGLNLRISEMNKDMEVFKQRLIAQNKSVAEVIASKEAAEKQCKEAEIAARTCKIELKKATKKCKLDLEKGKHHFNLELANLTQQIEELTDWKETKAKELEAWKDKFRVLDVQDQKNRFAHRTEKYKMQQANHELKIKAQEAIHGIETEKLARKEEKEFWERRHAEQLAEQRNLMQGDIDSLKKSNNRLQTLNTKLEERKKQAIKELQDLLSEKGEKLQAELQKYNKYCLDYD
eukprot:UN24971